MLLLIEAKVYKIADMEENVIEATYPITFRQDTAKELGEHLKNHHSVALIGMKRVGINNFLKFFFYHKNIVKTYINDGKNHLFIPVDLNDLVEHEIFPFWTLTLKRIVDAVEKSSIDVKTKKEIEELFLNTIQSQDMFLTMDSVRKSIIKIVEANVLPTIFFDRFDRIKNVVTSSFFANLQGLYDATHYKLTYVFTSFRSLDELAPQAFNTPAISVFARNMYIKPAKKEDMKIIFKTYEKRYGIKLAKENENKLFHMVDGYLQYLYLALIYLNERKEDLNKGKLDLFQDLIKDERINLQSEELWENLTKEEQSVLINKIKVGSISSEEEKKDKYLWDTGFINADDKIFSPLFENYIKDKEKLTSIDNVEFTKKENLLFGFLEKNINNICEREEIVNAVWPEVEVMGVSDWAIDRLVARVRSKLKTQKNNFEIQTVKTRGYKLITS